MANLYTKTGDKGETGLVGGSRVSKTDLRVECYGTVDEMGSALGLARSLCERPYIEQALRHIQGRLFSLAAEIASDEQGRQKLTNLISDDDVAYLEAIVDKCTETTGVQTAFVVPGKNPPSGALHLARTVVRRCERNLLRLSQQMQVRDTLVRYVNRLSDAVYALARLEETLIEQETLQKKVEAEVRKQLGMQPDMPRLTLEHANTMAQRAQQKAREMQLSIVFAVVDEGGNPLLLNRMEGSYMGSIDVALGKAYTANAFQMPTQTLGELSRADGPLYGIEAGNNGRIVLFGGGIPYRYQGRVVGGIGVSGGTAQQDMEIAQFALGESNCLHNK